MELGAHDLCADAGSAREQCDLLGYTEGTTLLWISGQHHQGKYHEFWPGYENNNFVLSLSPCIRSGNNVLHQYGACFLSNPLFFYSAILLSKYQSLRLCLKFCSVYLLLSRKEIIVFGLRAIYAVCACVVL